MQKYKLIKSISMDWTDHTWTIETKKDWLEKYGLDVKWLSSYFKEIKELDTTDFVEASEIRLVATDWTDVSREFNLDDILYEGFPDMCLDESWENIMPHIKFKLITK